MVVKWNTETIAVPSKMQYVDKHGKAFLGNTLTKTGLLSTRNKIRSINLVPKNINHSYNIRQNQAKKIIKL
jgi:hypothetical protein